MSTTLRPLPVRTSAALRDLITRVDRANAATRTLLLLGADAAGFALDGLDPQVQAAVRGDWPER